MKARRYGLVFAATASIALLFAAHASPVKVILDSDMIGDFDDMGALACLHALADRGECEILATLSCTRGNGSVAAIEICNAYYGRRDIPVGCTKLVGAVGGRSDQAHAKYLQLQKDYPGAFRYADSDAAPDAVEVYRRVLAAQPERSVVICSIGFLSNLRALLESKGDAHSNLSGRELVAKKVKKWVAMACRYPDGHEYNSDGDAVSSRIAFRDWPTPIVFSDFQYGRHLYSGRALVESDIRKNPVKDVYAAGLLARSRVTCKTWDQLSGHPSWDQSAVLAAVRGEDSYFNLERGHYEMLDDKGTCAWRGDKASPNCRLVVKTPYGEVGAIIDALMLQSPLKSK